MCFASVVLPEPLGPARARNSPGRMAKVMPRSASVPSSYA